MSAITDYFSNESKKIDTSTEYGEQLKTVMALLEYGLKNSPFLLVSGKIGSGTTRTYLGKVDKVFLDNGEKYLDWDWWLSTHRTPEQIAYWDKMRKDEALLGIATEAKHPQVIVIEFSGNEKELVGWHQTNEFGIRKIFDKPFYGTDTLRNNKIPISPDNELIFEPAEILYELKHTDGFINISPHLDELKKMGLFKED